MEERIAAYLAHRMPSARGVQVTEVRRIPGGASRETWSFDATWEQDHEPCRGSFILRRDPDASLLVTERGREFLVYRALEGSSVPAPRPLWLEADPSWLDRPFFIMERIDGAWTSGAVLLDPRFEKPRAAIAERNMAVLATIHTLDWRARGLEALGVPDPAGSCAMQELARWRMIVDEEALEPQPVLAAAVDWLAMHPPPPPSRLVLVHGDFRTGNFLFDRRGAIRGVLDWEMAHLGDPMEDIGWLCMRAWRHGTDLMGGLLPREAVYRHYEAAGGGPVDPAAVHWWEVFGNVKFAAICLTGARSYVEGRTRDILMAIVGRMVPPLEAELLSLMAREE